MIDAARRRRVRYRAKGRCEYCRIHEDELPHPFHVEHVIPRKHGGSDALRNLAWSCQRCNLKKNVNLTGLIAGEVIVLFHPRRQIWGEHFRWRGVRLAGLTNCGRATIRVLDMNSEKRIELRQLLKTLGNFPPEE